MSHVLLPFVVLPLYATLRAIPDDYARAARMLGANGYAVFRHVTLPLSMPGITSGLPDGVPAGAGLLRDARADRRAAADDAGDAGSAAGHASCSTGPLPVRIIGVLLLAVLALVIVFNRVVRLDRFVGQA